MKKTPCGIIVILAAFAAISCAANEPRLPSFLPAYYTPAFRTGTETLNVIDQGETNGVTWYIYATADEDLALFIENIQGEKPKRDAVFNNVVGYINQHITSNNGRFAEITATEAQAEVVLTNAVQTVFAFALPNSVQIWTFSRDSTDRKRPTADFKTIRGFANRQRYEDARQAGNVAMGHWQKSIHNYARDLLGSGRRDDALIVLKNLLATAAFNYEAHLDFMESTFAATSATNSAKTVLKNAEAQNQIVKAAEFLGLEPLTIDAFPPLAAHETGLQVILIPLPPFNPWLMEETAKVFQQITEIPVKVRRLPEDWSWGPPERIFQQRHIQNILVRLARQNIDFTGWTKDRYIQELTDAVASEDALSTYWIRELVDKAKNESGQYLADPYLDRLGATLEKYRSHDNRTLYVAITEANIYSGDNNYVFNIGRSGGKSPASIMSYHMMLGSTLQASFDSRQRLVERMAKELVPASLKQLGIPRSTDPTCPYSYSSGVDRLDQKTLTLSDDVKAALNKLRDRAETN